MVQTLGCGPTVGSPRSSSAPPSLGRGRVVPPPPPLLKTSNAKKLSSCRNRTCSLWITGQLPCCIILVIRKSHQNGDYLKQAMRKKSLAQVVEQLTGNPKTAGSRFLRKHNFFALLVLSSRSSAGSSLGFRAGSL